MLFTQLSPFEASTIFEESAQAVQAEEVHLMQFAP